MSAPPKINYFEVDARSDGSELEKKKNAMSTTSFKLGCAHYRLRVNLNTPIALSLLNDNLPPTIQIITKKKQICYLLTYLSYATTFISK